MSLVSAVITLVAVNWFAGVPRTPLLASSFRLDSSSPCGHRARARTSAGIFFPAGGLGVAGAFVHVYVCVCVGTYNVHLICLCLLHVSCAATLPFWAAACVRTLSADSTELREVCRWHEHGHQ